MPKEEFLSIIDKEIENLEKELEKAQERVKYFDAINSGEEKSIYSNKKDEARYRVLLVNERLNLIRNLVIIPTYVEIQARSDIEFEEEKKEKINELELKIKEKTAREELEKSKLAELNAQQEELILQFGKSLSKEGKSSIIQQGKDLKSSIIKQQDLIESIQNEIFELQRSQGQIRIKAPQEIRNELSNEILTHVNYENWQSFAQIFNSMMHETPSVSEQLGAAVADDFDKARQMAQLVTKYLQCDVASVRIGNYYDLPEKLRKEIGNTLESSAYAAGYIEVYESDFPNLKKLEQIVTDYETSFAAARSNFAKSFSPLSHSRLFDGDSVLPSHMTMEILQENSDKFSPEKWEHFQNLTTQINKLSKKIIKTRDVKEDLYKIRVQRDRELEEICKEIENWYKQDQDTDILGKHNHVDIGGIRREVNLANALIQIDKTGKTIANLKEKILRVNEEMFEKKRTNDVMKKAIEQQIRNLAGPQFVDKEISISSDFLPDNLVGIAKASASVQAHELIDKVEQEAQNQANAKEAELRGMTIEQLLQMKEQAMLEQSKIQENGEEDAPTMSN